MLPLPSHYSLLPCPPNSLSFLYLTSFIAYYTNQFNFLLTFPFRSAAYLPCYLYLLFTFLSSCPSALFFISYPSLTIVCYSNPSNFLPPVPFRPPAYLSCCSYLLNTCLLSSRPDLLFFPYVASFVAYYCNPSNFLPFSLHSAAYVPCYNLHLLTTSLPSCHPDLLSSLTSLLYIVLLHFSISVFFCPFPFPPFSHPSFLFPHSLSHTRAINDPNPFLYSYLDPQTLQAPLSPFPPSSLITLPPVVLSSLFR